VEETTLYKLHLHNLENNCISLLKWMLFYETCKRELLLVFLPFVFGIVSVVLASSLFWRFNETDISRCYCHLPVGVPSDSR